MTTAYHGLRVLDASTGIAGAMASMYFADQGADVARVLPRETGLAGRDPGFLCWDRNKQLCLLDPGDAGDRAQLGRLAAAADVAVFDQPPAELARRSLTAADLRPGNPALVHLWVPMHGLGEPWQDLPPDPLLGDALSSASGEHGSYDGGAVALVTPIAHYAHGALGAAAAAAALWQRNRTGRGRAVVVTGLQAAVAMQATILVDAPGMIRPRQRGGGNAPNFRLYACADGAWLYVATMTQEQFVTLLSAIDLLDVLVMPGVEGQLLNILKPGIDEAVYERLRARFLEFSRAEWMNRLTAAGVPNAPAQTREEWWASEVVASSGMRLTVRHDTLGDVELPGDPLRLTRTPGVFSHLPGQRYVVPPDEVWASRDPDNEGSTGSTGQALGPGGVLRPGAAAAQGTQETDGPPLDGLRVLDLGTFIAGPIGASVLGDFGADVVKVEGPEGDPLRLMGLSYLALHKNQRDVVLDVKSAAGGEALRDLVRQADVVVDNLRPGVRERIGTDYASLAAVNPQLVRGTITAWGHGNSLTHTPAFDPLLQARSGLIAAQGGDDAPGTGSMMVHDIGTGVLMAFGLLAALYARDRDGAGQEVVTSLVNVSLMQQSGEFVRYAGRQAARSGGRDWAGDTAAHRLYPCADGWVAVAACSREQLAGLASALEAEAGMGLSPEVLADAPGDGEVAQRIAGVLASAGREVWLRALRLHGVPAAPVVPSGGFRTDPWLAANRAFIVIDHPEYGPCTVLRAFADWSGWDSERQSPAPAAGADTRALLAEAGVPAERVEELLAAGVARSSATVAP
jgi:crotonobetainyl-CoA:carnitine CoA-transferase CaiB-like acyl-CoA transferase